MIVHEAFSSHRERFYAWVYERQTIWYRRHALNLPRPWTDDPILQVGRFTNAYHELDRGTIYCKDVVLPEGLDVRQAVMRAIAYRIYNRIETWDAVFRPAKFFDIYEEPDWDALGEALVAKHIEGPVFTGAHQIGVHRIGGEALKNPTEVRALDTIYQFYARIDDIAEHVKRLTDEPQQLYKYLKSFVGLGDFLAHEILSDLAYTSHVNFTEDSWAAAGPGAKASIRLIYGNRGNRSDLTLMRELQRGQEQFYHENGLPLFFLTGPLQHSAYLSIRNIEHSLCEYFKYNRAVKRGSVRQLYRGGSGYAWTSERAGALAGFAKSEG